MPKTALFVALSLATAGGFGALETASHAAAQTGIPLLAAPRGTPRPAPAWHNKSWLTVSYTHLTLPTNREV